jgi:hypothetical protein
MAHLVDLFVLADRWQVNLVASTVLAVIQANLQPTDALKFWEQPLRWPKQVLQASLDSFEAQLPQEISPSIALSILLSIDDLTIGSEVEELAIQGLATGVSEGILSPSESLAQLPWNFLLRVHAVLCSAGALQAWADLAVAAVSMEHSQNDACSLPQSVTTAIRSFFEARASLRASLSGHPALMCLVALSAAITDDSKEASDGYDSDDLGNAFSIAFADAFSPADFDTSASSVSSGPGVAVSPLVAAYKEMVASRCRKLRGFQRAIRKRLMLSFEDLAREGVSIENKLVLVEIVVLESPGRLAELLCGLAHGMDAVFAEKGDADPLDRCQMHLPVDLLLLLRLLNFAAKKKLSGAAAARPFDFAGLVGEHKEAFQASLHEFIMGHCRSDPHLVAAVLGAAQAHELPRETYRQLQLMMMSRMKEQPECEAIELLPPKTMATLLLMLVGHTFRWDLREAYNASPKKEFQHGDKLCSIPFNVGEVDNFKLTFYPHGHHSADRGWCSVYFHVPSICEVKVELSLIVGHSGSDETTVYKKELHHTFAIKSSEGNMDRGFHNFAKMPTAGRRYKAVQVKILSLIMGGSSQDLLGKDNVDSLSPWLVRWARACRASEAHKALEELHTEISSTQPRCSPISVEANSDDLACLVLNSLKEVVGDVDACLNSIQPSWIGKDLGTFATAVFSQLVSRLPEVFASGTWCSLAADQVATFVWGLANQNADLYSLKELSQGGKQQVVDGIVHWAWHNAGEDCDTALKRLVAARQFLFRHSQNEKVRKVVAALFDQAAPICFPKSEDDAAKLAECVLRGESGFNPHSTGFERQIENVARPFGAVAALPDASHEQMMPPKDRIESSLERGLKRHREEDSFLFCSAASWGRGHLKKMCLRPSWSELRPEAFAAVVEVGSSSKGTVSAEDLEGAVGLWADAASLHNVLEALLESKRSDVVIRKLLESAIDKTAVLEKMSQVEADRSVTNMRCQNQALRKQVADLQVQLQEQQKACRAETQRCQDLELLAQSRKNRVLSLIEQVWNE